MTLGPKQTSGGDELAALEVDGQLLCSMERKMNLSHQIGSFGGRQGSWNAVRFVCALLGPMSCLGPLGWRGKRRWDSSSDNGSGPEPYAFTHYGTTEPVCGGHIHQTSERREIRCLGRLSQVAWIPSWALSTTGLLGKDKVGKYARLVYLLL